MSAISDRFDIDPEESAAKIRRARERRLSYWANHVEVKVQPGMLVHRDEEHCICDACTDARKPPLIGPTLRNTNHRRKVQRVTTLPPDESVGSKPLPRQETFVLNKPLSVRGIAFSGRFGSKLWG